MNVAVIDVGKTNVKVALVDADGVEIAVRKIRNTVRPGPPYPHYDTQGHWQFILAALAEFADSARAISITAHGATGALVDRTGALALPILDYEHDGPEALSAEYDAARPPFEETGSPRLAAGLNLGAQLHWQFRTFPQARRTAQILPHPQYWAFRLAGVPAIEATSMGCHTDLWQPHAGTFSSFVGRMGWSDLFPPLRRAADRLGPVTPQVAQATGLDPQTPVFCGIHDSNASLYPHLLRRSGAFSVVSTGTWVVCMAVGGAPVRLDPARDALVNVDANGAPVPSSRFMGGREYEIIRAGAEDAPTDADRDRALTGDIMLLPSVAPSGGPYPGRPAAWTADPESPGERMAVLSWYLALMTATCLSMIGAQGPVVVEGPFAANRDYVDMLAAATSRPVEVSSDGVTGTSIGAALLAAPAPAMPRRSSPPGAADPRLARYAQAWRRCVDATS